MSFQNFIKAFHIQLKTILPREYYIDSQNLISIQSATIPPFQPCIFNSRPSVKSRSRKEFMFLVAGLMTDVELSHNTPVVIGFFFKFTFPSLPPTHSHCKAVAAATAHSVIPPGHQHSVGGALKHCCSPHKSTPFLFHEQVHCRAKNRDGIIGVTTGKLSPFIL